MPYYSAKQPQKARMFVPEDERAVDSDPVTQFLTEDRRLHLYEAQRLSIRKPRLDRILAGISGKGLTVLSLWIGGSLAVLFGLHHAASQNAASGSWLLSVGAIYLWWLAGPDDLELDLRQRTYQYRCGFLYLAPTLTGTFNDISTVGVQRTNSPLCFLVLIWNVPGRCPTFLGQFQTPDQANAQRTLMLDKLAL